MSLQDIAAWQDIAAAIALMLVFEGLMPFIAPARWRQTISLIATLNNRSIRLMGLASMLMGLVLLTLVR
jgi:uncharacterized protein YjeT (DUF2065 family)